MFCNGFLQMLENERMITNLPQLHDRVHHGLRSTTALKKRKFSFTIRCYVLYVQVIHSQRAQHFLVIQFVTRHHTFLSFSDPSVSRIPLACICLYTHLWRADISHLITYSTYKLYSKNIHEYENTSVENNDNCNTCT